MYVATQEKFEESKEKLYEERKTLKYIIRTIVNYSMYTMIFLCKCHYYLYIWFIERDREQSQCLQTTLPSRFGQISLKLLDEEEIHALFTDLHPL